MENQYREWTRRIPFHVFVSLWCCVLLCTVGCGTSAHSCESGPHGKKTDFCSTTKDVPPKKIEFVVRNRANLELLPGVKIHLSKGGLTRDLTTNSFGYDCFFPRRSNIPRKEIDGADLTWTYEVEVDEGNGLIRKTISGASKLNKFFSLYEIYLDLPGQESSTATADPLAYKGFTGDMHYHVSMRTHNFFGLWLYPDKNPNAQVVPGNMNWFKSLRQIRVMYKHDNGHIRVEKVRNGDRTAERETKLQAILQQRGVYAPYGASNKFTHFTQATHPHLSEGKVMLGYSGISPFEQATSRTWRNRFAANLFVTGSRIPWVRNIGQSKKARNPMTHWEFFNQEYKMITDQARVSAGSFYNHFPWRFYRDTTDLAKTIPTIVISVEGAHILQHKKFPNFIDFDLEKRSYKESGDIAKSIAMEKATEVRKTILTLPVPEPMDRDAFEEQRKEMVLDSLSDAYLAQIGVQSLNEKDEKKLAEWVLSDELKEFNRIPTLLKPVKANEATAYQDQDLEDELVSNISALKRMDPPIAMINYAHLAYNGMAGHSVGWDQGRGIANLIARRNYGLRVSDDKQYKSQWAGAFYTIPGVNKFGKLMMRELTCRDQNEHRIMLDMKHADPSSRRFFFDSIMVQTDTIQGICKKDSIVRDTIYPICSHCGVNGLDIKYSSPLVNDYYMAKADFVKTLYPFAINIFNEEITKICQHGGIIGIPLEQRILGGYLRKKELRPTRFSRDGKEEVMDTVYQWRWFYVKRFFNYLYTQQDPEFDKILDRMDALIGLDRPAGTYAQNKTKRDVLKILLLEYKSVEPFLYNLFHVVDRSGYDKNNLIAAWKHICIGSDLDGLIDPLDVMPTASQYPEFKKKLRLYIPIFLRLRKLNEPTKDPYQVYFKNPGELEYALDQLFYVSLRDFTKKAMLKKGA